LKRRNDTEIEKNKFEEFNSFMVAITCILTTWICLPIITLLPFYYPEFLGKMKVFSTIFENLKKETYFKVSNVFMFTIRRIVIVIIAVFLKDYPA